MISIVDLKTHFPRALDNLLIPVLSIATSNEPYLIRCHFLAQIAHESDGFHTIEEYASGAAYEGRKDLGNTQPGDGVKYKGRGYIQITGRTNYDKAGQALMLDLINNPNLLDNPTNAMNASLWFWVEHDLDKYALQDNCIEITRIINGGLNGFADRARCLQIFKSLL
jgi:putative chitinase